jgi:FkbM family methyltransferase
MDFIGQKNQDEWVIKHVFDYKKNGFFVDLAATDGVYINNTYLLETELNWKGICIEPHPEYFPALKRNRECTVITKCVDYEAHTIEFRTDNGYGSGVIDEDTDNNFTFRASAIEQSRKNKSILKMQTTTLKQILDDSKAPRIIDYLSFDVEGCETRIMRNFPFEKYTFLSMTIERPTPELNEKLFANGYVFVRNSDSMSNKYSFDSFYVHKSIPNLHEIEKMPFSQIPSKDW